MHVLSREISDPEGVERALPAVPAPRATRASTAAIWSVVAVVAVAGCAGAHRPAAPDAAPSEFENLQVLPRTITKDDLRTTMRGFAGALGVHCNHCHAQIPGGGERDLDFASDEKPEKRAARTMMRMTAAINRDYVATVAAHPEPVTCGTCHRGHEKPEAYVPPAPPGPPGGAPPPPSGS